MKKVSVIIDMLRRCKLASEWCISHISMSMKAWMIYGSMCKDVVWQWMIDVRNTPPLVDRLNGWKRGPCECVCVGWSSQESADRTNVAWHDELLHDFVLHDLNHISRSEECADCFSQAFWCGELFRNFIGIIWNSPHHGLDMILIDFDGSNDLMMMNWSFDELVIWWFDFESILLPSWSFRIAVTIAILCDFANRFLCGLIGLILAGLA